MKKIIIGIAVALSLGVVTLLVGPGFVDWNGYRAPISRQLSALVGQPVTIAGDVDFALLPTPTLSARDVRVANRSGGPDLLTVQALDVRVHLLPLLAGRIEAERIALLDPVLVVGTRPDGTIAWPDGGDRLGPEDVQLDRVTIENGTIVRRDEATGREERASEIFAQLSAGSLSGPFQLAGSLSVRDRRIALDMSAGRRTASGTFPVNATLGFDGVAGEVRFGGLVSPDPFRVQGDLRAEGPDLAELLAGLWPEWSAPDPARRPFRLTAALVAERDSVALNSLALTLGEFRASGAISAMLGDARRIDLTLSANRLDLDRMLGGDGRLALPAMPEDFGLPGDLTATIDIGVDALTWRGGLIRDARVEGVLSDGVVALNRLSAQLPGTSGVSVSGTLRPERGLAYADLTGRIDATDLRRLLDWSGVPVADIPGDRLRRMTAEGRLTGTAREFRLTGVRVTLDGTRATGGLAYVDRGRPGFGLRLELDRINLDAYWPGGRVPVSDPEWISRLRDLAGRFDANVEATAGSVTVGAAAIEDLRLDGTLSGGALTLRRAEIGHMAGASLGITGSIASIEPLSGLDLTVDVRSPDGARLLETLVDESPLPAARLGALKLHGRIQGGPERLTFRTSAELAGADIDLGGTVDQAAEAPVYDLALRVIHPRAAEVAGLILTGYAPREDLGGLDVYARVSGPADRLSVADLQGTVGPVSLAGGLTVDRTGERPFIDAELRTSSIPVDSFLPPAEAGREPPPGALRWSSTPIDLSALQAFDARLALTAAGISANGVEISEPALRGSVKGGEFLLEGFSGGFLGGRLGLSGRLGAGDRPELALSVSLVGADLARVLEAAAGTGGLSGTVDFGAELTAAGNSGEAIVSSLAGKGLVGVRDGAVDGFDLEEASRLLSEVDEPLQFLEVVQEAMATGHTPFAALNATFSVTDGIARFEDLRLVANGGTGEGRGAIDLVRWQMDVATEYTLHDHRDAPPFEMVLTGAIDQPVRRLQTQELQAYIARKAAEELARRSREAAPAGGTGPDARSEEGRS